MMESPTDASGPGDLAFRFAGPRNPQMVATLSFILGQIVPRAYLGHANLTVDTTADGWTLRIGGLPPEVLVSVAEHVARAARLQNRGM